MASSDAADGCFISFLTIGVLTLGVAVIFKIVELLVEWLSTLR
jgi:Zn-dependent membrane protease YugP